MEHRFPMQEISHKGTENGGNRGNGEKMKKKLRGN
jgi:hypothetical protein